MKPRSLLLAVLVGAIRPSRSTSSLRTSLARSRARRARSRASSRTRRVVMRSPASRSSSRRRRLRSRRPRSPTTRASTDVNDLPPGDYLVTFYYADITVERSGIHVGVGKTTPVFQDLDQTKAGGEVDARPRGGADDRSDVDQPGHHARQELPEEHPGPGPHVRPGARRGRRLAGRRHRRRHSPAARRSRTSTSSTASTRRA